MTDTTALTPGEIAKIAARIDRPVVLVGLMGVGKSTVGRRLAAMLGTDFVDVDDEIERAADRTVSEIFEAHGEAYFRSGERRVIARLMEEAHGVIATGGGAFVDPETRALILDQAIAVWLDCDIDTLVERTSRRNDRPLLRNGNARKARVRSAGEPRRQRRHVHLIPGPGGKALRADLLCRRHALQQRIGCL